VFGELFGGSLEEKYVHLVQLSDVSKMELGFSPREQPNSGENVNYFNKVAISYIACMQK